MTYDDATTPLTAWHFLPSDGRLQYGDRQRVEVGVPISVTPPLELCRHGLHASMRAIDALKYAPGPLICRVRMDGEIVRGDDKLCAETRTVLWMADATTVLHAFACWCAEQALERERAAGREPDPRSWQAIAVKRAWLRGDATDSDLAAAWAAAWDAAWDAAWAAQNEHLESMLLALHKEAAP